MRAVAAGPAEKEGRVVHLERHLVPAFAAAVAATTAADIAAADEGQAMGDAPGAVGPDAKTTARRLPISLRHFACPVGPRWTHTKLYSSFPINSSDLSDILDICAAHPSATRYITSSSVGPVPLATLASCCTKLEFFNGQIGNVSAADLDAMMTATPRLNSSHLTLSDTSDADVWADPALDAAP
ncbi:hypothetical protein DFJ73DRAFT_793066 [Zopfochytrium polystomum]|nr:hypothetical protein DFJ73DRAFT_793066 [Zopfochytrium polystomum]